MIKFNSLDTFTVSSKPIKLAYAHSGVFMPAFSEEAGFTFRATANPAQSLKYWYDDAYASELAVANAAHDPPIQAIEGMDNPVAVASSITGAPQGVQEKEPKSKKRKAEGEVTLAKKKVC